jgi:GntR family transcriptional repressor for pyruvate dehydrogenase complex
MENVGTAIDIDVDTPPKQRRSRKRQEKWTGQLGQVKPQISPRDAVSEEVLRLIRSGELKPGARLPSEPQLIKMTGVSRSSVREAIRSLETMGLIEIRRGNGTYVREIDPSRQIDAQMLLMLADGKVLEDLVEVRLTLEPLMVKLAAERATEADIRALREALDGMHQAGTHDEWRPPHLAFHHALAAATHNVILTKIWGLVAMFLKDSPLVAGVITPSQPHAHDGLYEAIAARDVKAAEAAMAEHIQDMMRVLKE